MGSHRWTWTVTITAALVLMMAACGSSDDVQISSSTQQEESVKSTSPGDADGVDAKASGLELAATSEFCQAANHLVGDMEAVGATDPDRPEQLQLAYGNIEVSLGRVASLAPNAGLSNLVADASALFLPVAELMREADWTVDHVDRERAAELGAFGPEGQAELEALTDELESYLAAECGTDVVAARRAGVDRFEEELAGGGRNDGPVPDQADIDAAPIGERGGQVFCDADRLWQATIEGVDDAVDAGDFVDTLLAAADVYTTWGERLPVEVAVATVDMNVGFAEVIVTFGETQDPSATREAYRSWRSGSAFGDGRQGIDGWLADNC